MTYGNKIEQLLVNAFAGESQARNRYTIFASIAGAEGYHEVSDVFLSTAENEREHAKLFYNHIPNGIHKVDAEYPFFRGSTLENLKSAAEGERDEWETIYQNSSDIARSEGYDDIADLFMHIIEVEKHHEHRFIELYNNLKDGTMFRKDHQAQWVCKKCGYILIGEAAPKICPCCLHPVGYFKIFSERY
ncbi:MAG: rubrerythrin family protein [Candidatus Gastranaerophilales bacterium]|nr:rubrerythrin family protein [Candidatus Gastranaerophilales bacterium]